MNDYAETALAAMKYMLFAFNFLIWVSFPISGVVTHCFFMQEWLPSIHHQLLLSLYLCLSICISTTTNYYRTIHVVFSSFPSGDRSWSTKGRVRKVREGNQRGDGKEFIYCHRLDVLKEDEEVEIQTRQEDGWMKPFHPKWAAEKEGRKKCIDVEGEEMFPFLPDILIIHLGSINNVSINKCFSFLPSRTEFMSSFPFLSWMKYILWHR